MKEAFVTAQKVNGMESKPEEALNNRGSMAREIMVGSLKNLLKMI